MKLLKFPYVVKRHIIKQMEYHEVFWLSWYPFDNEFILCTDPLHIFEKLRNHFQSLFGTNHFHLSWYQNGEFAEYFSKILGNLQVNTSELFQETETKQLEAYFEGIPNQEYVCIRRPLRGDFKESSEFYTIQNLYMKRAGWVGRDVLRFFKGRSAILEDCVMYEIHIIDFLEKWISNTAFNNLEFLLTTPNLSYDLNCQWIVRHFLVKHIDPSKKLPVYHYKDKSTNTEHEFASPYYMVRDCDGTVASIGIQNERFVFAVWHLNEKQMAEKFYSSEGTSHF
ncbi:unnamed protein product [Caenorhabditis brenneri]